MRSTPVRIAMAIVIITWGLAVRAHATPFAYISNADDSTVSVIDTATNTVISTISSGFSHPTGVAVNPAGTRVYVSNLGGSSIAVIDAFTLNVIASIPLGPFPTASYPEGIAVSPDGSRVYAAVGCCSVAIIDTATNMVSTLVPLTTGSFTEALQDLAINPAGTRVYVTQVFNNQVSVVDTTIPAEIAVVPAAGNRIMAVNPSGTRVYVTNECDPNIEVIDTTTNTLTTPIASGLFPCGGPFGLALNAAGTKLYVTGGGNELTVFDTGTGLPIGSTPVGGIPFGVQLTPDEAHAYVTSVGDNTVNVVDTATNTVIATIPVGDEPHGEGHFIGPQFVCGNGITEPGEGCDDGNMVGGDSCDADCLVRHDSMVVPRLPLTITIPKKKNTLIKKFGVKVKNNDVTETAGHTIRLTSTTTCPPIDVAVSQPNFGGFSNTVLVPGGKTKTAMVSLFINAGIGSTPTFNYKAPVRCAIDFTATTLPVLGTAEATPTNNTLRVELNFIDKNDPETTTTTAVHESLIKSIAPVTVTIPKNQPSATKKVHPAVVNADYRPTPEDQSLHSIMAARIGGTCPPGAIGLVDFDSSMPLEQQSTPVKGGTTKAGSVLLTVNRTAFPNATATSPQRCTATFHATGPTNPETLPLDGTNNTTTLTLDVLAK